MSGREDSKDDLPKWFARSLAPQALLNAGLVAAHSLKAHGVRRAYLFGAPVLGIPALGEYHAVNRARILRHRTHPQIKGVPIGALLGWYPISTATFGVAESVWSERGLPDSADGIENRMRSPRCGPC